MGRRLVQASLRNDRAVLLEVSQLLGELRTSWATIGDAARRYAPVPMAHHAAA